MVGRLRKKIREMGLNGSRNLLSSFKESLQRKFRHVRKSERQKALRMLSDTLNRKCPEIFFNLNSFKTFKTFINILKIFNILF